MIDNKHLEQMSVGFRAKVKQWLEDCGKERVYGLVRSVWRDPIKQAKMRADWIAGRRKGLVAKPALDSLHCRTENGMPASEAIDILFEPSQEKRAAELAELHGIGWLGSKDRVHFFNKDAR